MASYNAPRKGSMAFYPRVRAKKETPSLKAIGEEAKAFSFLGYKVGMTQVAGKNAHKGSPGFGQEVTIPVTIIECPAVKVLAIRAYKKGELGLEVLGDIVSETADKELERKIKGIKKTGKKKEGKETKTEGKEKVKKDEKKKLGIADFEKEMEKIEYFTLIVYTQPKSIKLKKKPDVSEINIGGKKEEQLNYAKEILGKEITIEDVVQEGNFLDFKAVTKGKGFQGVIKRSNVKMQRPKAKKQRIVGSISPWHPATVMYTVARAGQMGYHNRTEYNKKILRISDKIEDVNGTTGYTGYGNVKGKYLIIAGSVPGPSKRCIAFRKSYRPEQQRRVIINEIENVIVK